MNRLVGVEVEFSGISIDDAAEIIQQHLDCAAEPVSPHEITFDHSYGQFRLEVDFDLLKEMSREEHDAEDDDQVRQLTVSALSTAATMVTPLELVTPPLPEASLVDLNQLLESLAKGGAVGTNESFLYAFGVHFNPAAEVTPSSIVAHMQAFMCLYPWLKHQDETDIARRLTPYIDPFPTDYEQLVLSPAYLDVGTTNLIEDYLTHNATRNRALDMLPLLSEIDEQRVRQSLQDTRVNRRPTYHYRLPNSRVGEPDWSVLDPWLGWLRVERLANDKALLAKACHARQHYLDNRPLASLRPETDWIEKCHDYLLDPA